MKELVVAAIAIIMLPLSWILCKLVLNYTQNKAILDIPNERSSHTSAKPRGGGVAIVITFLSFVFLMVIMKVIPLQLFLALFGGGALIAYIGWMDDKNKGISIILRLIVQSTAAIWAVCWLRGLPQIRIGEINIYLGIFGYFFSVMGVIWLTNLYNFMDGIDGIAASEAVTVGLFAGCLSLLAGTNGLAALCFALAFSCIGFLIWNWAPAKIFMGDVGSGFLGFTFATLAIASENSGGPSLVIWIILLGVFLVDATVTLIRRIIMRECWYEAHRAHAYQCATQTGLTHKQVTLFVIFINIILTFFAFLIWYHQTLSIPVLLSILILLSVIQNRIYCKCKSNY